MPLCVPSSVGPPGVVIEHHASPPAEMLDANAIRYRPSLPRRFSHYFKADFDSSLLEELLSPAMRMHLVAGTLPARQLKGLLRHLLLRLRLQDPGADHREARAAAIRTVKHVLGQRIIMHEHIRQLAVCLLPRLTALLKPVRMHALLQAVAGAADDNATHVALLPVSKLLA